MANSVHVEVVLTNSESLPIVDVWMVLDVLRASTVIVSWFASGGDELYPVDSLSAGRLLAERLKHEGRKPILMGEQNAIAPEGFDLGNSPLDITLELVRSNPCAVMATTNGTVTILKAASTGVPVLIACARNAHSALSAALSRGRRVGILCSGRKGRPAWDDTLCAGLFVGRLTERFSNIRLTDSARLAHLTWTSSKDFKSSLRSAEHAIFLDKIGYGDDVNFAGEIDATKVVPELCELPDGDGMRAVLRLAEPAEQTLFPSDSPPAASRDIERPESRLYSDISSATPQDKGYLLNTGVGNVFFAGEKYKKLRKGKLIKTTRGC